jgi:hypothetical protein
VELMDVLVSEDQPVVAWHSMNLSY